MITGDRKDFDERGGCKEFSRYGKDVCFISENAALETIAERLSQWYDVNIIFNDEALKQLRYSVEMKRYNNIQDLLTKIEKTQKVKFLIQGKSIYIRKWMEAYDLLE